MVAHVRCLILLVVLTAMVAGCGGRNTRYAWSDYDVVLYEHYKNPAQKEEFIKSMKEIVEKAEVEKRVPPGIYAEYGFLLYDQGNIPLAIEYYQKEANTWPESKAFMTKVISNAQKRQAKEGKGEKVATKELGNDNGDSGKAEVGK